MKRKADSAEAKICRVNESDCWEFDWGFDFGSHEFSLIQNKFLAGDYSWFNLIKLWTTLSSPQLPCGYVWIYIVINWVVLEQMK